jgi:cellulose synthase/poly-beta-1,6-N-acetylglucosamine synthase-like glycosyltransferase
MKLGEYFIKNNLANENQIQKALQLQDKAGGQLGEILFAISNMRALDYYKTLAEHYGMEFVDLLINSPDFELLDENERGIFLEKSCLPIQKVGNTLTVAISSPSSDMFDFVKNRWGENTHIVCTSKFDVLWILQKRFNDNYVYESINDLLENNIAFSAKKVFSEWQVDLLVVLLCGIIFFICVSPINFLITLNIILTFSLSGALLYKVMLAITSLLIKVENANPCLTSLSEKELPIYTILIPLYKEMSPVLINLCASLKKMDYPSHKLDIKMLLEEDDKETIENLKKLNLPSQFEFIYVPAGEPRTKAKACNYGLKFARGEYLTLYDAEDAPDPNQLKIALCAFLESKEKNLVCVQSRLNFYNSNENWLTRMFTLEYTYWFDLLLPSLAYFNTPIPLGGTSNHFKTSVLKMIDAWDPYNVAEDADIGIRLHRLGYFAQVISTTTYEEANCRLWNWLKQRTRWIKGYMQTYIVHMRNPLKLWRALGTRGFIGFQLFVGGTILSNLSNLLLWVVFFMLLFAYSTGLSTLFPRFIIYLAWFNFIMGTAGVIFLNLLGIIRRRKYNLVFSAVTAPVYWLLMSLASYRALYQLIFKPSYWDKTEHGISKIYGNKSYPTGERKKG